MKIRAGITASIIPLICLVFISWGFISKSDQQKDSNQNLNSAMNVSDLEKNLSPTAEVNQNNNPHSATNPASEISEAEKHTNNEVVSPLIRDASSLEIAIRQDSPGRTKALLKTGANPNQKNPVTWHTPLMVAAMHTSSDEITRLLLEYGARIEESTTRSHGRRQTLLTRAITTGAPASLIRALIEHGAEVDEEHDGQPILHVALGDFDGRYRFQRYEEGLPEFSKELSPVDPDFIRAVIETGANVNAKSRRSTKTGFNALNLAASKKDLHPETIKILVEAGLEVNPEIGDPPLLNAAIAGNPTIGATLIDLGAQLNSKDKHGQSPLHLACKKLHLEFAQMLIDRGATLESTNPQGMTPLMVAACYNQNPAVLNLLLDLGASTQTRCNKGKRALEYAAGNHDLKNTLAFQKLEAETKKQGNQ